MKSGISRLARQAGLTENQARTFIECLTDAIRTGERVYLWGFGIFYLHNSPARRARNPRTGELIQIEARNVLKFKASPHLRAFFNGGPRKAKAKGIDPNQKTRRRSA